MKKQIILKRTENSPIFRSIEKGLYPNATLVAKIEKNDPIDKESILNFQLYAHSPLEEVPISFRMYFDSDHIPPNPEQGNLGWPSYNHLKENQIDIDENGVYVTNATGEYWLTHQKRVSLPNGLGEEDLSNWAFLTPEEIEALQWKE